MPVFLQNNELNKSIELPNAIVSVSGKKTIVSTVLAGKAGKVVNEHIYNGAYEITIRGIITDRDNPFPAGAIDEIKELYEQDERIEMQCAMTDIFLQDDDNVIIKSVRFPEMKGIEKAQAYELQLMSDKDFELIIE